MVEATAVEIPFVNLNDETVRLTRWLVEDGQAVRQGQTLAEVETSKALVELAASADGTIHLQVAPGAELAVGTIVAYIGDRARKTPLPGSQLPPATNGDVRVEQTGNGQPAGSRFSNPALALMERHGVQATAVAGIAMVRERDVQEYLDRRHAAAPAEPLHFALEGLSLDGVSLPSLLRPTAGGFLLPQFLDSLRQDPESIANLGSEDKCRVYRENGAEIGRDVHIGKGTLLISPQIQLADSVRLGENSSLLARERLAIGALSSFREGLQIRGATIVFGQNTFAGSRIQIGGGGHADPWAVLVVGDNAFLGDDLFINICRPVIIGKEVFLTQRAILVTHNIGQSILEGYENTFAPVVIEDFAQVGMGSTLYAGSRIGEGAILASNSYVLSAIPKGKLAMGVPAEVVRDAARPVSRAKQLQIAESMVRQFHQLLRLKSIEVGELQTEPWLHFVATHLGKTYRLGFKETWNQAAGEPVSADETVDWSFAFASRPPGDGGSATRMNLLARTLAGPSGIFADTAREFLRKRGIRLEPGPWRYRTGLI